MAGNMKVSFTVTATDQASKVLQKGLKDTAKTASETQEAIAQTGKTQQRINDENARKARAAERDARRNTLARERLGIRTEQSIQQEIKKTTDAYKGLARAGFASAREQERAFRATKARLRELNQEMRGYSRLERAQRVGGNTLSVAGGVAAGGAVLTQPVVQQMTYDRQLAHMSNTAFGKEGMAGRIAGREKLATSIRTAVSVGGGTKEGAASAMNTMLSNSTNFETANAWLPEIMKYATASGASPDDLARMAMAAKKSFGIKDNEIPAMFNMAIAAGKAGSFELKDMAKYLPGQFAFAGKEGMKGFDDLAVLLSLNQAAAITASDSDEAGNNVINLLGKINSKEAATAAAGVDLGGYGIDLTNTLANARQKGINPIEAFNGVIDKVVSNNPRYQELQKQLATTQGDTERSAIMESMAKILEGGAIGEIIADRQALMALLGYRNNPEYRKEVEAQVNAQRTLPAGKRAGDEDYSFIATTNDYKVEHAKSQVDFAQMDSVKGLADAAGSAAETVSELSQEFPGLTSAVTGATTAIQAMTAAAVTFAGIRFLTKGGSLAGKAATTGGVTSAVASASKGGALMGTMGKLLGFGGGVTALATFTTSEEDEELQNGKERWKRIRKKYPQKVIDAARERYQPWYQFGEGYSKENEQWIEQYLKDEANSAKNASVRPEQVIPGGASAAGDTGATSPRNTVAPFPAGGNVALPPINVTAEFILEGHTIARVVNEANIFDANRGTGGTN